MPRLVSIQVGLPRQLGGQDGPEDRPWVSGIIKEKVDDAVWLAETNLDGDGQADLKNHGGPDKAVLAYTADHYPAWRQELDRPDLPFGAFGENFTIAGLTEENVCIGDVYVMGDVRVQVSQPRNPCWKLARRWGIEDLVARVLSSGRTGWYLRALREGAVAAGAEVRLVERPFPEWTVARAGAVIRGSQADRREIAELAACPALAQVWRQRLAERLTG